MNKKYVLLAVIGAVISYLCLSGPSDEFIKDRVVRLKSEHGMCSGEQILAPSGLSYILTAGHCRILEKDGYIQVQKEDGTTLDRRILAEDPNSDLMLLEGLPGIQGLKIADSLSMSQRIRTFTHGRNMDTYQTEGFTIQIGHITIPLFLANTSETIMKCRGAKYEIKSLDTMIGELPVCFMSVDELISNASIVPGSSGGAALDSSGDLVGVASATDGYFGYFVALKDIRKFLAAY